MSQFRCPLQNTAAGQSVCENAALRGLSALALFWLVLLCCTVAKAQTEEPWNRLYVTNFLSNDVSVVDLTRGAVLATIPVGKNPTGMAVSPNQEEVYVANMWSGTVSVISTAQNEVTHTIAIPTMNNPAVPFGLAMMPDGSKVYVTNLNDGTVRVIDTQTKTVVDTITAAYDWAMRYIAISPNGEYAWAVGTGDGKISVIRTADNTVVTKIMNLPSARHLAFTPDGKRAYVTGEKFSRVYVIDTTDYARLAVIQFPAGSGTITVDIGAAGKFAMVSNFFGKPTLIDIDPDSSRYHQIIGEVPPKSSYEYCIVIAPDGKFAYLSNQADRGATPNSINIIDLDAASPTRNTIINSIRVGQQPWGIAIVKQPVKPDQTAH